MSQERFIRCKHCGLPHEADRKTCPITGKATAGQRRSVPPPAAPAAEPASREVEIPQFTIEPDLSQSSSGVEHEETPSVARFFGKLIEGKYRIDELIGRGGMGAVYRAEHTRLGKQVAIKVLMRGHSRGSAAERRFLREARAAGSIGHPNIVEVFDLGTLDDGTPYLVMELLHGESLADRLKIVGALTVDQVVHVSEQILSALTVAHRKGIIHRDMKPENVFLARRENDPRVTAKILDFGISKNMAAEDTLALTMTGAVVGTPYYLSPEQARGDREIDHRVDIWSVGVLMYEAITGVVPFNADNYNALMIKILNDRPTPPSAIRPMIPQAVERVITKALSHDAQDRFQTAQDMLEALWNWRNAPHDSLGQTATDVDDFRRSDLGDMTVPGLSISAIHGPDADDPTEISDSFSSADVDISEIDGGSSSSGG